MNAPESMLGIFSMNEYRIVKTYSQISPILMKPNRTTNYKLLRKQNGMKNRMRRLRNSLDPILEIVSINGACFT